MPEAAPPSSLSGWTIAGYGLGAAGIGLLLTVPALLITFYLAQVRQVPPLLLAGGLLLPQALDYLSGPFIGAFSDRSRRFGREALMAAGCVVSAAAAAALFAAPAMLSPAATLIWTALAFAVLVLGATLFHLPHLALAAELGGCAQDRGRLIAARMAAALGGVLLGGTAAPALLEIWGNDGAAFARLSLATGAAAAGFMAIAILSVQGRPIARAVPVGSARVSLRQTLADRPFVVLALAYLLQTFGAGLSLAVWPFYAAEVLHRPAAVSLLFGASMGMSLTSFVIWPRLAHGLGLGRAYGLAVAIFAAGAMLVMALGSSAPALPAVVFAVMICGFGTGGLQFLPFQSLAECAAAASDEGRTGVMTGIWVTGEKFGLAVGAAMLGGLLALGEAARGETIVIAASVLPLSLHLASAGVLLARPARARPTDRSSAA